jgi:metallo-beta-lactamase family protein
MHLRFLGGAGTVTGSKYLLETDGRRILIDCGLFQGLKDLRLRNWSDFPVPPAKIDAVVLTHAHIDHSGYLPLLVRNGFKGSIYCTPATAALCEILLADSGRLQEEEARFANRKGFSKHHPALPLYSEQDARVAMTQFRAIEFGHELPLGGTTRAVFRRAGHILGAASVLLEARRSDSRDEAGKSTRLFFSGDVGRASDPVLRPPEAMPECDFAVVESTYGDRRHDGMDPEEELARVINDTVADDGVVIIPAFSVGRTQTLLFHLYRLKQRGVIRDIPVYLNSPMSISASEIFRAFKNEHRLGPDVCQEMCDMVRYVRSPEESKKLNAKSGPMIILSANGMATGGRVLHHLKAFGSDPKNTILFAGYQAAGTRGASLLGGATSVKIHGEQVPIRARVVALNSLSAHADGDEIVEWLRSSPRAPKRIFITHGEPESSFALRRRIEERLGWVCAIPADGEVVALGAATGRDGHDDGGDSGDSGDSGDRDNGDRTSKRKRVV